MFIENFSKFIKYYGKGRKLKLFGFFILSLIVGSMEFVGIALVYPFILLIIDPESVIHTKYYIAFSKFFHVNDIILTAFILGFVVTAFFLAKNLFMIFSLYLQNSFISNWKLAISKKFMRYYLYAPYKNSLTTSASEKIYNLTYLIGQAVDGFIFRIINLMINCTILFMILGLLLLKFPFAAIVTIGFVIFSMAIQNKLLKSKIQQVAQQFYKASHAGNEKMIENINNLKEIKILSAEDYFYQEYLKTQTGLNKIMIKNSFYSSVSPYIIEILVVISLFLLATFISVQKINNTYWMVASYAIIVAAIFRIAPALNRIQTAMNVINTSRDFVKIMIKEYENNNLDFKAEKNNLTVNFEKSIKMKNINFSYSKKTVIENLNLDIDKGEFIGIIGLSGTGKTTLAEILMGLLPADSGKIFVDGFELNQTNFSAMRRLIGYVPQQINILEGSFKRNVAWGEDEKEIDEQKVIDALKEAQLFDFVSSFEDGINAKVIIGTNGLSQGQKQRLAIARALYKNPEILIFDEATSSLDVETENQITQMLTKLKEKKTIVAIAHRLSTLKNCNRLLYMKNGSIVDTGTFTELSLRHSEFEKLIKLSSIK